MLDLYNVPDPQKYLNPMEQQIDEADAAEPLVEFYNNQRGKMNNQAIFNLNNDDDDEDLVDDSDSDSDDGNGGKSV